MTQTKILLFSLLFAATLNINAESMSGYLDLSKLYGNTNAGQYFVGLALNPKATAILEITQSLSSPENSDQPGSEPQVCLTEFRVSAGDLTLVLTDAKKDQRLNATQKISLYSSYYDESEQCSTIDALLKTPLSFMPYFNLGSFKLNYSAPYNYEELFLSISVFPYSYSVVLNISKNSDSNYFVDNLKTQLSLQLKRGNKEALSFYTYAQAGEQDNTSTLSLGQGFIELK